MIKRIMTAASFAAVLSTNLLWAVPARQGLLRFTQPDGTVIELRKTGDERAHLVLTPDGYPVSRDSDGYYCYADIDVQGHLEATGVRIAAGGAMSEADRSIVSRIDLSRVSDVLENRLENTRFAAPQSTVNKGGIGLMDDAFLGRKELKGLVILAQYADVKFSETCTPEFFNDMLNSEGFSQFGGTGSARDYFIDSSSGQFVPEFDVYGPVTLPEPMAFYGGNNKSGSDSNAAQMIVDACRGLDEVVNFADYDLDGDGFVDNVFVFYAGYGEASYGSDDSVWPHQWNLGSAGLSLMVDGVRINKYACSNELELDGRGRPQPDGIGTFVHEFSHVLGLPDLYVTSGTGYWSPGIWSVLDQGPYNNDSRTPPAYSIYERTALGWIEPQVLDGPASVTLEAINESNSGCIIPTAKETEFFLLENRQKTGWDKYIPGHGMLIWHIDYNSSVWQRNVVNNQRAHNYVDIEEACGTWYDINNYHTTTAYYSALADYAFPGPKNVTSFTDDTTPSMQTWSGGRLSLPITNIAEVDGVITFDVAGGHCDAAVPEVQAPSAVGEGWFDAAWLPAEGAAGYILNVNAYMGEGTGECETADFGSASDSDAVLPDDWEFISCTGAAYTSESSCGESVPSLKLTASGSGFVTKVYDSDVTAVELWTKGIATTSQTKVNVEGLVGDKWISLASFTPTSGKGVVTKIEDITAGVRRVRVTYAKSAMGNLAVDDVKIYYAGGGFMALDGFRERTVDGTSCHVDCLIEDVDIYNYRVCAVDEAGRRSAWSDYQQVEFGANAGVEDVVADRSSGYRVDGRVVTCWSDGAARITLSDLSGRVIAAAAVSAGGSAAVEAPGAGLYLLTIGDRAVKVSLK